MGKWGERRFWVIVMMQIPQIGRVLPIRRKLPYLRKYETFSKFLNWILIFL